MTLRMRGPYGSMDAGGEHGRTLPVLEHREEIAAALSAHQVIVVSGETGSGKTTQIPQICLAAGRGGRGLIACTQPRRIAAVSVAERVNEELGPENRLVGWQHRFACERAPENRIKFMTDGILLAELRSDPLLRAYDTVMVDEAHERTLNIDFILGCLKRILPRRPDLKVIVSSATLETKAFSEFFGGAPVISVPGRLHPVEVRYRPMAGEDSDLPEAVADAVAECLEDGTRGDILVFLSGERDIRAAQEAIDGRRFDGVETIPLLASLPAGEQRRAFTLSPGRTRVVLATNVAETSVTIPGVRFVIDSGLARVSRYNPRARVKRLHVEPVSQASAAQRKGRCGRIGPGVCIRLYSAEDLAGRPEYTDPEIRRASLAGVMLSMLDWGLGDVEEFPFLQPPASAAVRDAKKQLAMLGAVRGGAITRLGRRIAKLPLEPALSRMLFEADRNSSLRDALTVVSALACEDPLVHPVDELEKARAAHAQWRDKASDFAAIVNLWRDFDDTGESRGAQRRRCEKNFVSYRKLCEWRDVREELVRAMRRERLDVESSGGGYAGLHKSLLCGLLPNIGLYDPEEHDYRGAGGTRFVIFPGSGLAKAKTPPQWVVAAELVDTSRLFARRVAEIDPEWIEPLARDVARYVYSGESWNPTTGIANTVRRCVLFGLTVQDGVRCDLSKVDPKLSRKIFIREGLVGGRFPKPVPEFVTRNLETIRAATEEARKTRESSVDPVLEEFCARYDSVLPPECVNAPSLRGYLRGARDGAPDAWLFARRAAGGFAAAGGYPDRIFVNGAPLRVTYVHDTASDDDGITLTLRPDQLPLLDSLETTRLVPGAMRAKVLYLLRTLPRSSLSLLAANCGTDVRGGDTDAMCDAVLAVMPNEGPLLPTLVETLASEFSLYIPYDTWSEADLPREMRMNIRIADERGKTIYASRDMEDIAAFREEYERIIAEHSGAPAGRKAAPPPKRVRDESLRDAADALLGLLDASPQLHRETVKDAAEQIGFLIAGDFEETAPPDRLASYPRYFEALLERIEKARADPARDLRLMRPVREAWTRYVDLVTEPESHPPFNADAAERYRWLMEEHRVLVFAQKLGVREPASRQRVDELWKETLRFSFKTKQQPQ